MSPVEHFIPDSEAGGSPEVIAAYIEAGSQPGDLIVDPFCRSATVVQQALQAGRRVIAVNFYPLDALGTRLALTSIPVREVNAAFTRLADSPKQNATLREHLDRIYQTTCRTCGKPVVADHYIWEREKNTPKQVHYHCLNCEEAKMHDCDSGDLQVLGVIEPRGLHYWYLLGRVARESDPGRRFAASLLNLYTPRNLYVLSNLVLRIEDLFADSPVHDFMRLALMRCLEWGSKLNPVPDEPMPSPRSLLRPLPRFVERNVWRLFEENIRQLAAEMPSSSVRLAVDAREIIAPPPVSEGGAARAYVGCLSVRQLAKELPPGSVRLVYSAPPATGRERWALPYLWTGFLYGHEQASLLWPLARRRGSDWTWYLSAFHSTLSALQKLAAADGQIVLVGRDKGLTFHEILGTAAASAALRARHSLYHCREAELATEPFAGLSGEYRLSWTPGTSMPPFPMPFEEVASKLRRSVVEAAQEALQQRGEPSSFVRLHCHIWVTLGQQGVLQRLLANQELPDALQFARTQVRSVLQSEIGHTITQLMDTEDDSRCWWWLTVPPNVTPLHERVEQATYEVLAASGPIDAAEFLRQVYRRFPGPQTPDREWALACLASCARQTAAGLWELRADEREEQRQAASASLRSVLSELGTGLGFQTRADAEGWDVEWIQTGQPLAGFVVLDLATLSHLLAVPLEEDGPPMHRIAVVLATRQELIELRLSRSAWLRNQLQERGWRFILDSDLEKWASQKPISLADLHALTGLDWLSPHNRTQLALI